MWHIIVESSPEAVKEKIHGYRYIYSTPIRFCIRPFIQTRTPETEYLINDLASYFTQLGDDLSEGGQGPGVRHRRRRMEWVREFATAALRDAPLCNPSM